MSLVIWVIASIIYLSCARTLLCEFLYRTQFLRYKEELPWTRQVSWDFSNYAFLQIPVVIVIFTGAFVALALCFCILSLKDGLLFLWGSA